MSRWPASSRTPAGTAAISELLSTLAPALAPRALGPDRSARCRQGLMSRVRRSALAHSGMHTSRREDAEWAALAPGVQARALGASAGLRVDLLRLAPHAAWPWPAQVHAQEILVIEGDLDISGAAATPQHLVPLQQRVLGCADLWQRVAGSAGATVYVRSRHSDLAQLAVNEAQWWQAAQADALQPADPPWAGFLAGSEAAVLHAHGAVASMLVRLAAGASLPDHGHSQDEDCYMLAGDMYLGDILVRAGDYQLARAGGQHVGVASDAGAVFYFHGAVPPAASEPA
jgi:quercetin dioxygenase-like cupin family protein